MALWVHEKVGAVELAVDDGRMVELRDGPLPVAFEADVGAGDAEERTHCAVVRVWVHRSDGRRRLMEVLFLAWCVRWAQSVGRSRGCKIHSAAAGGVRSWGKVAQVETS